MAALLPRGREVGVEAAGRTPASPAQFSHSARCRRGGQHPGPRPEAAHVSCRYRQSPRTTHPRGSPDCFSSSRQEDSHVKKLRFATLAALLCLAGIRPARAADETMGGLGFHVSGSPFSGILVSSGPAATPTLGMRQWFTDRAGLDLGVGYNLFNPTPGTQRETRNGF